MEPAFLKHLIASQAFRNTLQTANALHVTGPPAQGQNQPLEWRVSPMTQFTKVMRLNHPKVRTLTGKLRQPLPDCWTKTATKLVTRRA